VPWPATQPVVSAERSTKRASARAPSIALELPAVVERHDRLNLAPEHAQDEVQHVLGALDNVVCGYSCSRR